jgi:hypothetical protein
MKDRARENLAEGQEEICRSTKKIECLRTKQKKSSACAQSRKKIKCVGAKQKNEKQESGQVQSGKS